MKLVINKKECEIKFNIGAWKRLSNVGISPINIESKINEDLGNTIFYLIKHSLVKESRETITDEDIEESCDLRVIDKIQEAIKETTPTIKDDGQKN